MNRLDVHPGMRKATPDWRSYYVLIKAIAPLPKRTWVILDDAYQARPLLTKAGRLRKRIKGRIVLVETRISRGRYGWALEAGPGEGDASLDYSWTMDGQVYGKAPGLAV